MTSRLRRLAGTLTYTLTASLVFAHAAVADTNRFGRNLGEQARSLAVALFLAVAGLVTLPILGRRDVSGGIVLGVLVLVLGGFIFAQGSVRQVIVDLWQSLVS